jgi:site-specific DNA-methyltransferase (adenine-specific)
MACAIEDAGFEIRDQLAWAYGSGMNKVGYIREENGEHVIPGWGGSLKPAWEPICLARNPLIGSLRANMQQHGTGAFNIDECRIEASARPLRELDAKPTDSNVYAGRTGEGGLGNGFDGGSKAVGTTDLGRWPANLLHDGSDEVLACFPDSPGQQGDVKGTEPSRTGDENTVAYGKFNGRVPAKARRDGEESANRRYTAEGGTNFAALPGERRSDGASAARFFYASKADADDRIGSKHPTIKPVDLMQWLVRLVTPKGGVVLDPFAGTGTTGEAAWREGMRAILIEREPEYQDDIARRMDLVLKPTKRAAVAKTKNKLDDPNALPLFGGTP